MKKEAKTEEEIQALKINVGAQFILLAVVMGLLYATARKVGAMDAEQTAVVCLLTGVGIYLHLNWQFRRAMDGEEDE